MTMATNINRILELIAARVRVIHGSSDGAGYEGGGDIDCIVEGLDPLWPLRIQPPDRLVNRLRYDVTATSWFVLAEDEVVSIDTLEDPEGIGKYGFETSTVTGNGLVVPGQAAAYLAVKRLKKDRLDPVSWRQVAELAARDREGFRDRLAEMIPRTAAPIEAAALEGRPPSRELADKALKDLRRRRLRDPLRALRYAGLQSARVVQRLSTPTGLYVVLVGPDGAGKSTIAEALATEHLGFRRARRLHWRPGLLPGSTKGHKEARGGLGRTEEQTRDVTRPHQTEARGRAKSVAAALYHWADFLAGSVVTIWPATRRSTLLVAERPWWDLEVDPLRYRLDVPPRLVRGLGRVLRKPDLVLRLEASPEDIYARKPETSAAATSMQLERWRELAPTLGRTETIDVGDRPEVSVARARAAVLAAAADQAFKHLGPGWVAAPNPKDPRWWLPRGSRAVERAAFDLWTPMTRSGAKGWRVAGALAKAGGLRVLPRAVPPREVVERVAVHLEPGENIAVHRTNHPGRFIVFIVSKDGGIRRVAKVVTTGDMQALDRAAQALTEWAPKLVAPLRGPRLLDRSEGVLVLEAIQRRAGWDRRLPVDVARSLGSFARAGYVHGDFAPWNLIPADGWVLLDWESAREGGEPFEDILHFIVQSHVLLGDPSADEVIAGVIDGRGWIGEALRAFADASGHDLSGIGLAMTRYLEESNAGLDMSTPEAASALDTRRRLADAFALR